MMLISLVALHCCLLLGGGKMLKNQSVFFVGGDPFRAVFGRDSKEKQPCHLTQRSPNLTPPPSQKTHRTQKRAKSNRQLDGFPQFPRVCRFETSRQSRLDSKSRTWSCRTRGQPEAAERGFLLARTLEDLAMGQNSSRNRTAGFCPCFHLPGFHFGYLFLTHSQLRFLRLTDVPRDIVCMFVLRFNH